MLSIAEAAMSFGPVRRPVKFISLRNNGDDTLCPHAVNQLNTVL